MTTTTILILWGVAFCFGMPILEAIYKVFHIL